MKYRLLPLLAIAFFLLFAYPSESLLFAQSSSCPFSFEPQFMGEGNCFRILLRNNDPQQAPNWVEYALLDDSVWVAGEVDGAKIPGGMRYHQWHFHNDEPLAPGASDTGYICFISTVPTVRIELTWGNWTTEVLCRDTVEVNLPHPNNACVGITGVDLMCFQISTQRKDPDGARPASAVTQFDLFVPISVWLHLQNRAAREIGSIDMTGLECQTGNPILDRRYIRPTVVPGDNFEVWINPSAPFCFFVDGDIGWGVKRLDFIYNDSTDGVLCADSVFFIANAFDCFAGSVTESTSRDHSSTHLRIAGLESGEGSISFVLKKRETVRLWLVDMNGREIVRLIDDQFLEEGKHVIPLKRRDISSGSYICLLRAGEEQEGCTIQIAQ